MMIQRFFLFSLLLFGTFPAAAAPKLAHPQDGQDIERVEAYLNSRHNMSAQFIQSADNGQTVTGNLQIKRPGKMNLTYDPPIKDFIIADGSFVYLWDGEMENSTTVPIGDSLADLILRENVKLTGDLEVTDIERGKATLNITVQQVSDPGNGTLTLLFEDYPMILHGWRVQDAQGRTTTVALQNMKENIDLPDRNFTFVPPSLGRSVKSDRLINQ